MRSVFNGAYAMLFSDFLYKSICYGYSFELPRLVEAIQTNTHNIRFYKEVGCNLKTTKLLDCALIGACMVIRSNTVYILQWYTHNSTVSLWLLVLKAIKRFDALGQCFIVPTTVFSPWF